ncbi:MAG: RNA polymerase sigma factor [Myxococcales bacterium]|nr:RNA polymerase sigma factor [Myxococcales bacterium]
MVKADIKLVAGGSQRRQQLADLSDDELMLLCAGGQDAPFETLVDRHQSLLVGYAMRFLGERQLAREVVQDVFITAWEERASYRPQGRFRAYLIAIAFNRCRAAARRRQSAHARHSEVAPDEAPAAGSVSPGVEGLPLEQMLEAERAARLHRELLTLDERTRSALILRFFHGLSYDEISAATGRRTGTLKSQVSRGLRTLYQRLSEESR